MAEYIEREAVLQKVKKLQETDPAVIGKKQFADGYFTGLDELEIILRGTSAADAVEVVHGRWDKPSQYGLNHKFNHLGVVCSACASYCDNLYNYCPNCGAKMDGEAVEG